MRNFMKMALGAATLLAATPLLAQEPMCQGGDVSRVRLSKIRPGFTMADFRAAAAAHIAWYKAHGFRIDQRVAPILLPEGKTLKESPDEVMTVATGDYVPQDKQDDGWKAFVAKYRAAADIVVEKIVCLPKAAD